MKKERNEYELYRMAIRNQERATHDLERYKRTGDPNDKTYYNRHRAKSYYYRKQLATQLGTTIKPVQLREYKANERVMQGHTQYLKTRKETRTTFTRMVKYKDKEGKSHKERITYKFANKRAIQNFKEQVKQGYVPVPRSEDERRLLLIDEDVSTWNLATLTQFYKEGS